MDSPPAPGASPVTPRRSAPPPWLPRFRGPLHDPRTAVRVGRLLGPLVLVCFLSGLFSHVLQHPPRFLVDALPSRPVWGYRLSQGTHVATGIAMIPVLLVKLWTVYPRLFAWPPARSLAHALERLSIAVLVAASVFQLATGLLNITQWYPWPFSFVPAHFAVGWLLFGSVLVHVAVKAPVIVAHWRAARAEGPERADRRALLLGAGAAVGAVTLTTVGQSVTPLGATDLLAPRHPDYGPLGLPVNRTARAAGVREADLDGWRLRVRGPRPYELSLAELAALPQHTAHLPIACVEGWSKGARWEGVRVRDLVARAGAEPGARLRVVSLERHGTYRVMEMGEEYSRDPLTLLALRLNGHALTLDHGSPARIIAPNRPGVLQTKWVAEVEVLR
ncbi:molybdopterin-dependent oxidoreductase [Streptomyces sp. P6-2-1]|uniref:molybdopterin-dependent oxidoreductase n=1 Tax=unclassified Streptomyces TaxID=2593676 RepID=UPI003D36DC22